MLWKNMYLLKKEVFDDIKKQFDNIDFGEPSNRLVNVFGFLTGYNLLSNEYTSYWDNIRSKDRIQWSIEGANELLLLLFKLENLVKETEGN